MLLDTLLLANNAGLEEEISQGIVAKIADTMPELTDHSPGSPHVVMAEALAWGSALLLYYVAQQPQLFEDWLLTHLYQIQKRPATNATAGLVLTFSTAAPPGGRTVLAGTKFTGGGSTWTTLESFTYPESTIGNETQLTQAGTIYNAVLPVNCDLPGSVYNTAANTITQVTQVTPGLISVTNPLPATGGNDLETDAAVRARYFATRSEQDLLVTHLDFERAASTFLGPNSRVQVVTPPPTPGFVHLSALYPDGTPLVSHDAMQSELNRRSPMAPIRYVPPLIVDVTVSATVNYDPNATTAAVVQATATSLIRGYVHPTYWPKWGNSVNTLYVSDLIAKLQNLSGVLSVTLTSPAADVPLGQPNAVVRLAALTITPVAVGAI